MSESPVKETNSTTKPVNGKTSFTGAAIKGSSLLNTVGDIRAFVQRGSVILINNVAYEISTYGEWNSSSVQLSADYAGDTNLSVNIVIPAGSFSPKRKKVGATSSVSKEVNIQQMVQGLDSITEHFGAKLKQRDATSASIQATSNIPVGTKSKRISKAKVAINNASDFQDQNNSIPTRRPRTLPPLPAALPAGCDDDLNDVDDDSIDAAREKESPKPTNTNQSRPQPAMSGGNNAAAVDGEKRSKRPARGVPQEPIPPRSKHEKVTRQRPAPEEPEVPAMSKAPSNSISIEEQRRAALLRVQQKMKEDQALQEKAAAAKEEEARALREVSENKAKELQARTALRVEQYMAEKQRNRENQKELERYEEEQRQLKNQQFLSSSRHLKMKEIRKDAQRRLQQLAYEDIVKAQIAEDRLQKSLLERRKKYDVNTTFLPRLDGGGGGGGGGGGVGSLAQGSVHSSGLDSAHNPPGRVVKSIANELEQFELDSQKFPEEPVLRSRSAKQQTRSQVNHAKPWGRDGAVSVPVPAPAPVPVAVRVGSLPAIAMRQKAPISSGASSARSGISPRVAVASKAPPKTQPTPQPPPRDEDDWSDDEPDLVQEAAMRAQANRRNSTDPDALEEDSLNNGDEEDDDDDDMDAAMERQIFGTGVHQQPKYTHAPAPPLFSHESNINHSKPPMGHGKVKGKGAKGGKKQRRDQDVNDDASDCSDITIDSVLGGANRATAKVKTPVKTIRTHTGLLSPMADGRLPTIGANTAVRQVAPGANYFAEQQQQQMQNLQQMQQQVTFAPRAPPALPYQQQQQQQTQSRSADRSPSVSPVKAKAKPFRKLKPIPISSEYRPVLNPVF